MTSPRRRLAVVGAGALALLLLIPACGREPDGRLVSAGAPGPAATSSTAVATSSAPEPSASIADGLDPAQLRAIVEAPRPEALRASSKPTADRVTVGGVTRWRVRVPGRFPLRSARVQVLVGGSVVGEGVVAPDLGSLTAVTDSAAGLVNGAEVAVRWEGSPARRVGTLVVAR